ncbi:DUF1364 domain-containing protein [Catenovulum sediminis]|uniref:DUF1364 domain-containing protein n=1 Tax=Catenovulum sediminis TaxID=1740262 RepID=A0ABV1RHB1_9ALTE
MTLKSKKLRDSAKGQECQVRIPGICNHNPETVVLAHVGKSSGMAQKSDDIHATFACFDCHDALDKRQNNDFFIPEEIELFAWHGVQRTQKIWLEMGLIEVVK